MEALPRKTLPNQDLGFFKSANNYGGTPVARSQAGNSRAPATPPSFGDTGPRNPAKPRDPTSNGRYGGNSTTR